MIANRYESTKKAIMNSDDCPPALMTVLRKIAPGVLGSRVKPQLLGYPGHLGCGFYIEPNLNLKNHGLDQ